VPLGRDKEPLDRASLTYLLTTAGRERETEGGREREREREKRRRRGKEARAPPRRCGSARWRPSARTDEIYVIF